MGGLPGPTRQPGKDDSLPNDSEPNDLFVQTEAWPQVSRD